MSPRSLLAALVFGITLACSAGAAAQASAERVATIWRLLDYIAVDYREAVAGGEVINPPEYDEMLEFSATASALIAGLPDTPQATQLRNDARALEQAIAGRADPDRVATRARSLAGLLVQVHPIPLLPVRPPDHARGAALYAQLCVACHGAGGAGDGPAAAGLDPPPIDFSDRARADQRSLFALYQVIEQGLEGTSMAGYRSLPADDLWAMATYVGALAYPEPLAQRGRALLERDPALRARIDFKRYVGTTPAELAHELGSADDAAAIIAWIRRQPGALQAPGEDAAPSLAMARRLLAEAMAAHRDGDAARARTLALSAYLDGVEPVEPLLAARDKPLMVRIEAAMAQLRSGLASGADGDVLQARVDALDGLFAEAEQLLGQGEASPGASFAAAFAILLREGLEALLIVIAMIALLRKAGRDEMLPWVHGGWICALLAGAVTWVLATWVLEISGASRELSEGFGALLAAGVLVWVGIWMHGKSHADAWQRYVHDRLGQVLGRGSGLLLLGLVFVVVYREVFETILFFAALWGQGSRGSVLAGGVSGALALAAVGWALMRYSRRLPIAQFFRYSSILIAVLAVVLAGKAVSALQEAGYVPVAWLDGWPRAELLGVSPTLQGVAVQGAVVVVLVAGFWWSNRTARAAAA